jgi:hypothetical protein
LLAFSAFVESIGDKISASLILIGSLIFLLFFTFNREGIGTDFYNYKEIYYEITINHTYTVEFGFVLLNYLAGFLGGFKMLLLLTSTLNLTAIIFVLKSYRLNISMGVLTYYSLFYLNHNFNTIRHGLMAAFVWVAIYFYFERKKIKSLFFYIASFFFHNLAILFYPLQFLTLRRINFKYSITLLIILYIIGDKLTEIFMFLNIYISQFSDKLNYYVNDYYGDEVLRYKFGLGFFLYLGIYFLLLKYEDYFDNRRQIVFFNRLLFLGIATLVFFASISIFSERIANVLLISLVFIFASIDKIKIKPSLRFVMLVIFIMINFFYLIKTILGPGIDRTYQYIPYNLTFF